MESSDLQHHHHRQQMNSGLMRYRSAPSSYFNDMLDREFCQQFFDKPSSPETERIFARFMNSDGGNNNEQLDNPQKLVNSNDVEAEILPNQQQQRQPQQQSNANINNYSSSSGFYQSSAKPPLPSQGQSSANNEGSYSLGVNQFPPMRTGGVSNSNLIRHSSSPAGLFANINLDALGFGAMRGMGTFGASNNSTNEEASFSPPSRLNTFSSGPASSPGLMSPITEIDDKSMVVNNQETGVFADGRSNSFVPSFPMNSWDDTPIMPDNITGLKRLREDDVKPYSSETQNVESVGTRPLAHHLSLLKTSSEMAAIDNFLQFQDSVPCKIRAKRGCATHPRSIAERVRRTRISERMRKLQELVPNMEKQTNTADMLDLAVEYIKDLQKQVQTLSDSRAKCTCSNKLEQQQQ